MSQRYTGERLPGASVLPAKKLTSPIANPPLTTILLLMDEKLDLRLYTLEESLNYLGFR
jgi:hypothetical protein